MNLTLSISEGFAGVVLGVLVVYLLFRVILNVASNYFNRHYVRMEEITDEQNHT